MAPAESFTRQQRDDQLYPPSEPIEPMPGPFNSMWIPVSDDFFTTPPDSSTPLQPLPPAASARRIEHVRYALARINRHSAAVQQNIVTMYERERVRVQRHETARQRHAPESPGPSTGTFSHVVGTPQLGARPPLPQQKRQAADDMAAEWNHIIAAMEAPDDPGAPDSAYAIQNPLPPASEDRFVGDLSTTAPADAASVHTAAIVGGVVFMINEYAGHIAQARRPLEEELRKLEEAEALLPLTNRSTVDVEMADADSAAAGPAT